MRPDASKKLAAATPKKGVNPAVVGAVIAAVLIVGVVVAILIGNSSKSGSATAASGSSVPAGVIGGTGGGIVANAATAKSNAPTMDLYEDFQCSNCGALEKAMGPEIFSLAKGGQIKLVVHVLSFLDTNLKNDSSTRSANAASCASDAGKFLEYHRAVFAGQPAEGVGYTDAQLTAFAKTAGITGNALTTWQKCASSGQHAVYVTDVQTAGEKAGVFGTPTVKLNGKDITSTLVAPAATPASLAATVAAATK
jgi:protein-disulfide isomerase